MGLKERKPCRYCQKLLSSKLWKHEKRHRDQYNRDHLDRCDDCKVVFFDHQSCRDHLARHLGRAPSLAVSMEVDYNADSDQGSGDTAHHLSFDHTGDCDHFSSRSQFASPEPNVDENDVEQEDTDKDMIEDLDLESFLRADQLSISKEIFNSKEDFLMYLIFEGSGMNKVWQSASYFSLLVS